MEDRSDRQRIEEAHLAIQTFRQRLGTELESWSVGLDDLLLLTKTCWKKDDPRNTCLQKKARNH